MIRDTILPGPDDPVIDDTRLLAEFGGAPEVLAELRDLFLEHAPVLYEGILAALDEGRAEAVVDQAHSLKGSCATYGAMRLAIVCRSVEMAARAGDLDGVRALAEALATEYDAVFAAIGGITP